MSSKLKISARNALPNPVDVHRKSYGRKLVTA